MVANFHNRKKSTGKETVEEIQHKYFAERRKQQEVNAKAPPSRAVQSMDYRMISQKGFSPAQLQRKRRIEVESIQPNKRIATVQEQEQVSDGLYITIVHRLVLRKV